MTRASLFARCQGPHAVPIQQLLSRGYSAAETVRTKYNDYLGDRLIELERAVNEFFADRGNIERRDQFLDALQDIRSSAATAGREWVSRFAGSLETTMRSRGINDENVLVIVKLHLDALKLAATHNASEFDLAHIERGLAQVTIAL